MVLATFIFQPTITILEGNFRFLGVGMHAPISKPTELPSATPGGAEHSPASSMFQAGALGAPMTDFMRRHPMLAGLAVLAAGATTVGISNQAERENVLRAPEIGLRDIPSHVQSLVERAELLAQRRSLEAQIGKDSTTDSRVADRIKLEFVTKELEAPHPASMVRIKAIAELDKISHEATALNKAADNPIYEYVLKDTDGSSTEYRLVCHQQFAPDQRPVDVTFAMNLSEIKSSGSSFIIMPASFPGLVALPGSGEAILSSSDIKK